MFASDLATDSIDSGLSVSYAMSVIYVLREEHSCASIYKLFGDQYNAYNQCKCQLVFHKLH